MEYIRKISVFLMTALMFVATTNIVLSAHICSGELYNLSLFDETTSCCNSYNPVNDGNPAHTGSIAFSDGNYCCFSKSFETKGVDIIYPSIGIRDVDYQVAVLEQLEIFGNISLPSSDVKTLFLKPYLPHIAERDIPVLIQSFLL